MCVVTVCFLRIPDQRQVYDLHLSKTGNLCSQKRIYVLVAGKKKRVLTDLLENMKKERNRLAKKAYEIMHLEDLNTRIRDKGLDMILEVKPKESNNAPKHPWVHRIV